MIGLDTAHLLIGEETQYFFDDVMIESVIGLTRTVHSPVKASSEPVVQRDRPWEHVTYFSCNTWSLWRDAPSEEFRLLYTDWKLDRERLTRGVGSIIDWRNARLRQLYATSRDGMTWDKPELGLHDEDGRATNIVFGDEELGSVYDLTPIDDPFETHPDRRFKTLFTHVSPTVVPSTHSSVRVAFSPDGVHWRAADEVPVFGRHGNHLGDVTITVQDPTSRTFLLFTRYRYQAEAPNSRQLPTDSGQGGTPGFDQTIGVATRRNRRRVFVCESADFVHWTEPRLAFAPIDGLDNLDDSFYGMTPLRLGGQWIGFLNCFHMVTNTLNVELVHSRDGRNWQRLRPTHPWLDCGPPGAFDQFMVNMPSRPVTVGDEVFVFYGGAKNHHDWWFAGPTESQRAPERWAHVPEVHDENAIGYHLGLAKLRRDGYVSLDAGREREGLLVTQPFLSPGDRLVINAACGPSGSIRVEVTDEAERPLPGRSLDRCDAFTGDATEHVVTWDGDPTVPAAEPTGPRGMQYRRLRVLILDARLYSFRVERAPTA